MLHPLSQRLAQGCTISLTPPHRLKHYQGWQPAGSTARCRESKEGNLKKATQTLLQAWFHFYLAHTFPWLGQQRPSPLLSNKLLVHRQADKQGRCCNDSTSLPAHLHPWTSHRAQDISRHAGGLRTIDSITSHSSSHCSTETCR